MTPSVAQEGMSAERLSKFESDHRACAALNSVCDIPELLSEIRRLQEKVVTAESVARYEADVASLAVRDMRRAEARVKELEQVNRNLYTDFEDGRAEFQKANGILEAREALLMRVVEAARKLDSHWRLGQFAERGEWEEFKAALASLPTPSSEKGEA